jgi:hypothetical protein
MGTVRDVAAAVGTVAVDGAAGEDLPEESIYEVMKATMRRQKEELDAKNAASKQQRPAGQHGRPGPVGARPANEPPPSPPAPARVADVADLGAVWSATRRHLNSAARYLEGVLGHSCEIAGLNRETGETVLLVPGNQKGFANERARAKIEECMRAVTGLPVKLALQFIDTPAVGGENGEGSRVGVAAPSVASQRIPPEVMEAIKKQPIVQELMKRLDGSVVHVEMLHTEE